MTRDGMDAGRDLERTLGDWLAREGPQDVPDRVVEVAIERAASTDRLRPWPAVVTGLLDRTRVLAPGGDVVLGRRLGSLGWSTAWILVITALLGVLLAVGSQMLTQPATPGNGEIAFDADGDIWLIDPTRSSTLRRLTTTADASEQGPVWSPDGRRLAYWVTTATDAEIHVVHEDGSLERVLTAPSGLLLPPDDAIFGWSPDGRQLAAPARGSLTEGSTTRLGVGQVVVYDLVTGVGHSVAPDLDASSFGWSPDGRWIGLLTADDVYLMPSGGGTRTQLSTTPGAFDQSDPLWSSISLPTFIGTDRVAFTADLSSDPGTPLVSDRRDADIVVAGPDGADRPLTLIGGPTNDVAPRVSPDGRTLAFGRAAAATAQGALAGPWAPDPAPQGADLYVTDMMVGREAVTEPDRIAQDVWPDADWSPNGLLLVAKSTDWQDLVLIDPRDQHHEQRLDVTGPDVWVGAFSWRPLPP